MSDTGPPSAPAGYAPAYQVRYPTVVLLLGSFALGLIAAGSFGWILWEVHGAEMFAPIVDIETDGASFAISSNLLGLAIPFGVALVVIVVVHELLHGLTFEHLGYDVEYGVILRKGVFYTTALEQFQEREQLFYVALVPLFLITIVGVPLLFVPHPLVTMTAYLALILNTSGSIGDIYMTWRLWRMPRGTLLYDTDIENMYAFEPTAEA